MVESLEIGEFPWQENGYRPKTFVKLVKAQGGLVLNFKTDETPVLARFHKPNDMVCMDSCMEFFFSPDNDDRRFFNFEFNPFGTILIGISTNAEDCSFISADVSRFEIETEINENGWSLNFFIPFSFIKEHFSKLDFPFRSNFYKCAEETKRPHFGCWNAVKTDKPDYHQPNYFGMVTL